MEAIGALGDTEHSADRTENRIGCAFAIRNGLKVIIVLLTTMEKFSIPHLVEG